jgi:hypothetical protein
LPRNLLPWVLLAVAAVVAVTVLRNPAPPAPAPAASSAPPVVQAGPPGVPVASGPVASARTYDDPPLDETEQRDVHIHIQHELCEEGAGRINVLEGLDPADKKGFRIVSACLRHGNVAWYKCVLKASTRLEAGTCNRRLLNSGVTP